MQSRSAAKPVMTEPKKSEALPGILRDFDERVAEVVREQSPAERTLAVFKRAVDRIDRDGVRALQSYVREEADALIPLPGFKYLDLAWYLLNKSRWVVALDLDRRPPERILDLGAGAGHFPFLAQSYGHEVVGIDMANDLYTRLLALYGVNRLVQMIVPGTPLPECGKFDLVTAFQTTFNRPVARHKIGRTTTYWTVEEWNWFFGELSQRFRFPARIYFELNHQPVPDSKEDHAETLMDLFERNGAAVTRKQCVVQFSLNGPLVLK
jgi:SAM-dependent methyltransferase